MTMTDTQVWERLGRANELLTQIADPASPISVGRRVWGDDYMLERIRLHLAGEAAIRPPMTGYHEIAVALATRIPWPTLATKGLWPGDVVTHEAHGRGVVAEIVDEDWPRFLPLVSGGSLLVRFGDPGATLEHWVPVDTLTNTNSGSPY